MAHSSGLKGKLETVGKSTFKACYDVIAKNYNKEDKRYIEDAVIKHGLSKGKKYKESSVTTKVNGAIAIFRNGLQEEALKLCQSSRVKD